jgi:hypothetical protein
MREFVDEKGVSWRVWSVTIDKAYTKSGREGYLGELQNGWLCFESGEDRRRLAQFPDDWAQLDDRQLTELLAQAALAPRRRNSISGEFPMPRSDT